MASGSVLLMALTVFASYQYNTLNKKELEIKGHKSEIVRLDDNLFNETQLRITAESRIVELEAKIVELRDSVSLLQDNIKSLKRKIRKQGKTLKALSAKLKILKTTTTSSSRRSPP